MLSQDVCVRPSVCLSVTRRYSDETAKHVVKHSSPAGSHAILVFPAKHYGNIQTGTPLTGPRMQGGMKKLVFRPISRFVSEMIQDIAIVTMKRQ